MYIYICIYIYIKACILVPCFFEIPEKLETQAYKKFNFNTTAKLKSCYFDQTTKLKRCDM